MPALLVISGFQKGVRFREFSFQTDVKSFHSGESGFNTDKLVQTRFLKIAPELAFTFRRQTPRSTATNRLTFRGYAIQEEGLQFRRNLAVDSLFRPSLVKGTTKLWGKVVFQHLNERSINPFSYTIEAHGNSDFVKLSAEGNLRIDYHRKGKSLYLRGFAGKLFYKSGETLQQRFLLQSTYTGENDYLYEGVYFGRNERDGFPSHQVGIREGGLKVPTPYYAQPLGTSDNWLGAINISSDLPFGNLPVRLFLDVATFSNAGKTNPSGSAILYDGGLSGHFYNDIITVYWPFVLSSDYKDYYQQRAWGHFFWKNVCFSIESAKCKLAEDD